MRWLSVILVVASLEAGCGPTVEQQRSARMEALQLELEGALATWTTDAKLGVRHERQCRAVPRRPLRCGL